jgi:hypothetical protein
VKFVDDYCQGITRLTLLHPAPAGSEWYPNTSSTAQLVLFCYENPAGVSIGGVQQSGLVGKGWDRAIAKSNTQIQLNLVKFTQIWNIKVKTKTYGDYRLWQLSAPMTPSMEPMAMIRSTPAWAVTKYMVMVAMTC